MNTGFASPSHLPTVFLSKKSMGARIKLENSLLCKVFAALIIIQPDNEALVNVNNKKAPKIAK